jgi:hypothetical protein
MKESDGVCGEASSGAEEEEEELMEGVRSKS